MCELASTHLLPANAAAVEDQGAQRAKARRYGAGRERHAVAGQVEDAQVGQLLRERAHLLPAGEQVAPQFQLRQVWRKRMQRPGRPLAEGQMFIFAPECEY